MQKTIEIHLLHIEIPQPSPDYYIRIHSVVQDFPPNFFSSIQQIDWLMDQSMVFCLVMRMICKKYPFMNSLARRSNPEIQAKPLLHCAHIGLIAQSETSIWLWVQFMAKRIFQLKMRKQLMPKIYAYEVYWTY